LKDKQVECLQNVCEIYNGKDVIGNGKITCSLHAHVNKTFMVKGSVKVVLSIWQSRSVEKTMPGDWGSVCVMCDDVLSFTK
jgi:hypothetical protein